MCSRFRPALTPNAPAVVPRARPMPQLLPRAPVSSRTGLRAHAGQRGRRAGVATGAGTRDDNEGVGGRHGGMRRATVGVRGRCERLGSADGRSNQIDVTWFG
ncbi:hypothetical protein GUJ93_ZPchr0013g35534 [Zizania palustris]|uniref:Uncharacterized protein n=1 Tax=Zizania palustris TaxID=103762 RepID=A0A8J5WXQ6_ZIZPA|nr:hypothetical protein GUJ93_ZPchr0013g35534 [Zizania palustris]